MFYLPPDEFWYLTVARLSVTFDDLRNGIGTGFFVCDGKQYFLITARHVVDPTYLPPDKKRHAICTKLDISFQCAVNPGTENASFAYQTLSVRTPKFFYEKNELDVAVVKIPEIVLPMLQSGNEIRPCSFPLSFLASDSDLSSRYAGEPVVFVGFPDNSPLKKDGASAFHYPLLRQGVFAYPPIHGIDVVGAIGHNYGLLDSFAQSGFSGGPVISLPKGWADGSWHPKEDHRPSKVVGLICGHYRSKENRSDGVHSGLSYFARASSIEVVISEAQESSD